LRPAGREAIGQHHGVNRAGAAGGYSFEREALLIEQPIEHAPGKSAVDSAALKRQVDDFLSSDIFPGNDRSGAGTSCAGILINQFHCCYGGISCHRCTVDSSPLLHCKDRNIIFLAGLIFRKRNLT
jgi:hypothetical protein